MILLVLKDQITSFITQHKNQSGIQHIGFVCADNIKDAVRTTKANGAQFLSPLAGYYLKVSRRSKQVIKIFDLVFIVIKENNGHVIEDVGENVAELAELGILLDDEVDKSNRSTSSNK